VNGTNEDNFPEVEVLPSPHNLFKHIFNTPQLKRRLMRFLGVGKTQAYALLSGERPCLIKRFCDLIDEALAIDPTGKKARRLAEYPRRYLLSLTRAEAAAEVDWCNHSAADELLDEASQAIRKLNSLNMRALNREELEEARTELLDVQQVVRQQLSRVDVRLRLAVSVRRLPSRPPHARVRQYASAGEGRR
jgi:hypothetical protein